jgi:hypothetical protein
MDKFLKYTSEAKNFKESDRQDIINIIKTLRNPENKVNFIEKFGYDSAVLLRIFSKNDLPVCKRYLNTINNKIKTPQTTTPVQQPPTPVQQQPTQVNQPPTQVNQPPPPKLVIPTNIKDMSPTERKNYLNPYDIKALNDPKATVESLQNYVKTTVLTKTDQNIKNITLAEFERKINQLKEREKEEGEIKKRLAYNFNYESEFQLNSTNEIKEKQSLLSNPDEKKRIEESKKYEHINLEYKIFDEFSHLNVGLYPKLISIMLNPEIFCNMWYNSLQVNKPVENSYIIVNELLHTFFILVYKKQSKSKLQKSFRNYRENIIERDTKLFNSLRIQNLILFRDRLIIEKKSNEKDEFNDFRGKIIFNLINKKINEIKEDPSEYIFNYKLLNELQKYYLTIVGDIVRYKNKAYIENESTEYESILELFYYDDQIKKSLNRLNRINDIFSSGKSFSNIAEIKSGIKYSNLIENTYIEELITKFAQVLSYVKERNDAGTYGLEGEKNPRYDIIIKYEQLEEKDGIVSKKELDIKRDHPISLGDPGIKYYDFEIKYFNYPKVIGLQKENDVYFNPTTWKKDVKGNFIGPPPKEVNYQISKAKEFVNDPKNKKMWEHYKLGKINRYYGPKVESKQIAADPECGLILLNKLRNFENIIIVGNGQSGAGKTAALISRTTNGVNYPGLLPCISDKLIKPKDSYDDKTQYFELASVKLINLYLKLDDNLNEINKIKAEHYWPYNIKLFETDQDGNPIRDQSGNPKEIDVPEYKFEPVNGQWRCKTEGNKNNRLLDQIIAEAFEIREEEPTKNNPNSSRSHIVVCVTFTGKREDRSGNIKDDYARIVICDLAGVEDRFTCELSELIILDRNYTTKSNKYKTLNEVGIPFTEEQRTKMRLKPIQYDNYFCSNKYYTNSLFPNKLFIEKKKLIDDVILFKKQYEILLSGKDPIRNKIAENIDNFITNPIDKDSDYQDFLGMLQGQLTPLVDNNILQEVITKIQPYTYQKGKVNLDQLNDPNGVPINKDSSLEINLGKLNDTNESCNTMEDCCKISDEKDMNEILEFMKDFTKLPDGTDQKAKGDDKDSVYGNFEIIYKGKTNEEIKKAIKDQINKIINEGKGGLFSLEDKINLDLNKFQTKITETNKEYKDKIKKLEKECQDAKANGGTNDQNSKTKIQSEKSVIEKEIKELTQELEKEKSSVKSSKDKNEITNKTIVYLKKKSTDNTIDKALGTIPDKKIKDTIIGLKLGATNKVTDTQITYLEKVKPKLINAIETLNNTLINTSESDIKISNLEQKIKEQTTVMNNLTPESLKQMLDIQSDSKLNDEKIKAKQEIIVKLTEINIEIQNAYYNKLIKHRHKEGAKRIIDYLSKPENRANDIQKVRYLIQQLVRFSQLEFNCILRRKEGFMINTSLKEMQKFIGSILFDSAKRRFNKVLIENNLLKMDEKIYRYNDYIKYNSEITLSLNTILKNINLLKELKNTSSISETKDNIIKDSKKVKKQVLQYFMYILGIINGNEENYQENIDLGALLIYICLINTIITVLINDKINFDLIINALSKMGTDDYEQIFNNKIMKNITGNIEVDLDNITFLKLSEIFSKLIHTNNNTNEHSFEILKMFYQYSKNPTLSTLNDIFNKLFNNNYEIKCKDTTKIYDNKNKINSSNDFFKNFCIDLQNLWDKLNNYTTNNINIFKEEVRKATYDNSTLHPTPLLYSSPSIDSCVLAKNKFDDEYDKFYNYKKNDSALEFLFEIMTSKDNIIKTSSGKQIDFGVKGFGLEIENSTLVIFTVINITPNPTAPTNNPPTPPFININKLKLIYKTVSIEDSGSTTVESVIRSSESLMQKIGDIGQKYLKKLEKYDFYAPFVTNIFNDILNSADNIIKEKGKQLKEKVIDFIDSNNATTLLGTVDFEKFTKIRDPTQPYFICDDKQESILKQLVDVKRFEELLQDEKEIEKKKI